MQLGNRVLDFFSSGRYRFIHCLRKLLLTSLPLLFTHRRWFCYVGYRTMVSVCVFAPAAHSHIYTSESNALTPNYTLYCCGENMNWDGSDGQVEQVAGKCQGPHMRHTRSLRTSGFRVMGVPTGLSLKVAQLWSYFKMQVIKRAFKDTHTRMNRQTE